jgi:hypothetical protein
VDRLGQTRAPHGTHLVARDTAERLVLRNLSDRTTRAARALGDHAVPAGVIADLAMAARILGRGTPEPAPVEDSTVVSTPLVPDPVLAGDARWEADRVHDVRRLASLARGASSAAPGAPPGIAAPAAGRIRSRGRRRSRPDDRLRRGSLCLFATSIVDARGCAVDSQTVIVHVPAGGERGAGGAHWRAALEATLAGLREPVSSLLRHQAAARLESITPLHRAAVDRLARREARLLAQARLPLARPLVQAGLFDRRALHEAAAARRIDERAVEDAERHADGLRARLALSAGEVELLAAAAIE